MEKQKFFVTISRQFGSGGAEIGSKVAAKLGVKCYDKSILEMTSVVTGLDKNIVVSSEEQTANTFWYSGFLGGDSLSLYDKIFIGQSKVIKNLAEKASCVFVGRCASRILNDYDNVIRIFICAPMEIRKKRVAEIYKISLTEAEKMIKKNDKARSAYYKKYGDAEWGKAENYDLIVNTKMGTNKAAECIADLVTEIMKTREQ